MPLETIKEEMTKQRDTIKFLVGNANQFILATKSSDELENQNKGEMIANAMLGLRHLEDAAMRFGKVIQAADGGQSPLGGPDTPIR